MAKPGAFPLAFIRISSQPSIMAVGCQLIVGFNRRTREQVQFLGLGRQFSNKAAERCEKPLRASSWEQSAERFLKSSRRNEFRKNDSSYVEDVDVEEEDGEVIDDPRWNNIRKRYVGPKSGPERPEGEVIDDRRWYKRYIPEGEGIDDPRGYNIRKKYVGSTSGPERPEVRRWKKEESWGNKTWKEAKESTVPKMVGEGVYGVGPVMAALSAGRREFYALYIQEGLELSSNTSKKKDKKAFQKVLKMADKIGLSQKEVSKHDLNMVADNRPHQGLVLDASPLEMVGIKELEPVSTEGEKAPLWLALDEVTDPQNLGAIIRSAYFFGACGVVLCAKNSAPLSGVVSKASAGSLELMELRSCRNMMQFLASSAGNGWRILGGSVSPRAVPLSGIKPGEPTVLVLGSEGMGLRPLVERSCTELIRIQGNLPVDLVDDVENPGQELRSFVAVESLNVSVAAGVLLHHLTGSG